MRIKLAAILFFGFFISNTAMAVAINSPIKQEVIITNFTNDTILITDNASSIMQADPFPPKSTFKYSYHADYFTIASGQTFSHTILITYLKSEPICTITSNVNISQTSETLSHPASSNETKCSTSVYQSFDANGKVYGFTIDVH